MRIERLNPENVLFRKEDWDMCRAHLVAQQDVLKKIMETTQVKNCPVCILHTSLSYISIQ